MGMTGMDILLSSQARQVFPYAVECRNQEKVSIWRCIADAEAHGIKENLTPMGIIWRNRMKEPYVLLPFSEVLRLLKNQSSRE